MEIYITAAVIIGIVQIIWFLKKFGESPSPSKPARLFNLCAIAIVAGTLWPVTILFWITSYEAPTARQARIIREQQRREQQRHESELAEQELLQRRTDIAAAQKRAAEDRARVLWTRYYSMFDDCHVSEMSGEEFERFVGKLYARLGYTVSLTASGADQGADLILCKEGRKTAVQAKRWSSSVGNAAVQEVISGKLYYGCSHGLIVTTSTFSKSAIALAAKDPTIQLVDRQALGVLCQQVMSEIVPTFSWDAWKKIEIDAQRFCGAGVPSAAPLTEFAGHEARKAIGPKKDSVALALELLAKLKPKE